MTLRMMMTDQDVKVPPAMDSVVMNLTPAAAETSTRMRTSANFALEEVTATWIVVDVAIVIENTTVKLVPLVTAIAIMNANVETVNVVGIANVAEIANVSAIVAIVIGIVTGTVMTVIEVAIVTVVIAIKNAVEMVAVVVRVEDPTARSAMSMRTRIVVLPSRMCRRFQSRSRDRVCLPTNTEFYF